MSPVAPPTALVLPTDDPVLLDIQARAAAVLADAEALVVTDAASRRLAVDLGARVTGATREAEARRGDLVKPFNDHVKAINELFRRMMAPIVTAKTLIDNKLITFDRAERQRAAEAQAAAERERLLSEARLREAEKAEAAGQAPVAEKLLERAVESEQAAKVAQAQAAPPPKTVRTESGTGTMRTIWTYKVTNLAEVPREYLELDAGKVRKAIAGGIRKIDGLEIYPADSMGYRRA